MKRLISLFLALLLSSTTFFAQSAGPPLPAIETVQQSQGAAALTNQDIVSLVKAKLATEIIIAKIQLSTCDFDTSPAELQHLKGDGVPAEIIVAMIGAPKAEQSPTSSSIEANKPVTVPDGTLVEVEAIYSVVSSDIEAGNAISFRVVTPVKVGGVTVIEAGAPTTGKVLKAKRGGRWGRAGQLTWTLQDVEAVDGTRIPLKFERSQKGDSKAGTVTTGAIVTGLLLLPIAPVGLLWGFKRGEDAFISAGRRYNAFVGGDVLVTPVPRTNR